MGDPGDLARRDVERRREAAEAFDRVIAEIRELPGFDGFLRPPPVHDLLAAAADGPVVIVNVSRFGSHALILTGGGVLEPVPLTGLTPEAVSERVVEFPHRARVHVLAGRWFERPRVGGAAVDGYAGLAVGCGRRPGTGPAGCHRPA